MARLEARRSRNAVTIGLAIIGVIAVILYLATTVHTGLPWSSTTIVKVAFNDVDSLETGDQVRQNSVRIGRVRAMEFVDDQALVTLELQGDQEVFRDARAAVWDLSSLGTKFVEFHPGTPAAGPLDGAVLSADRNVDSADLYEVLNVLDAPTRDAATSAVRELGGGLAGHSADLHDFLAKGADVLTDIGTVSSTLAADGTDLVGALQATDRLAARFAGREQQIADLVAKTANTFEAFAVDDAGPLGETLRELPSSLDSARTAFTALDAPLRDTEKAMAELRPGAEALGAATGDLRGAFREGIGPLVRLPDVADQAEPAVEDLEGMFSDARPLAPKVTEVFDDARPLVSALAPYAEETGQFFVRGNSFVADRIADGIHYARLGVAPGPGSAVGGFVEGDMVGRNLYPAPGEAKNDRVGAPLGGDR